MIRNSLLSFLICLPSLLMVAQEDSTKVIRVGLWEEPPFVIQKTGNYQGLCIDLWEEIAEELNWDYEYHLYTDPIGLIRALDFREVDIAINPFHVNRNRLEMFDASQPFFLSSISIVTTSKPRNQFQAFLRNFFSLDFLKVVLLLLLIIFCFGTLLWLVERKHNKFQFRPGIIGLLDGLWWSAVTMTTVGYGDKSPKTTWGRSIAIIWMFTAVIIISGFTATIASTLTVNSLSAQIESLDDLLSTDDIGTIVNSPSAEFLREHGMKDMALFQSPEHALNALLDNDITAIVYDKTALQYLIQKEQLQGRLQLLPISFHEQYLSVLLPKDSDLRSKIDPTLVTIVNSRAWEEVLMAYDLGEGD